ncbi:hypothetical protein ACQPZG_05225 (plasmid) [Streptomyces sp. CA-294286]|uniref:hypothetical protein n=1 Tax=Streptomyces sp. CA-294286 TaxID=3240070 RepID=UPI003D91EB1F
MAFDPTNAGERVSGPVSAVSNSEGVSGFTASSVKLAQDVLTGGEGGAITLPMLEGAQKVIDSSGQR